MNHRGPDNMAALHSSGADVPVALSSGASHTDVTTLIICDGTEIALWHAAVTSDVAVRLIPRCV